MGFWNESLCYGMFKIASINYFLPINLFDGTPNYYLKLNLKLQEGLGYLYTNDMSIYPPRRLYNT